MQAEEIPTTADELGRAPRWQCGLGQLPGGPGHPAGKNANEPETLETSAVLGLRPAMFARPYFSIRRPAGQWWRYD